jgi:HEAT repeat protein
MVREVAAETLGICKAGVQSADALIKVLADEFWQVRLKGVRSLGVLKVSRAVAAIGTCLSHPQANLRKESAAALGEIAHPAGLPLLEGLADDPDPDVRKNVRWALQRIGASGAAAR